MGISLKDIGNFAVGAIERDKELTKESLENRKEELKATRAMLIAQKSKRYEKDIAKFEEEDKKYKAIQAVNKQFAGKTDVDPAEWGRIYLQNYKPTEYATMVKAYGENTPGLNEYLKGFAVNKDFKTFSTEKAIDTKYQDEVKSIMADTTKQIKDARGDSFLINQILGLRNKKISEAESIKTESATGIEQAKKVNTEVANIETKPEEEVSFTFSKEDKAKGLFVPKSFKDEAKGIRKDVKKELGNTKKEAANTTLEVLQRLNIPVSKEYLTFESGLTSGPVTGFTGNGRRLNDQIGLLTNQSVNFQDDKYLYLKANKETSLLPSVFSSPDNKNIITNRIYEYTGEGSIQQKQKQIFADKENFVSLVPFSIVTLDDIYITSDNKNAYTFENLNKKDIGKAYFNALKKIVRENDPKFEMSTEADAMNAIQEKLLKLDKNSTSPLIRKVKEKIEIELESRLPKNNLPSSSSVNSNSVNYEGKTFPLTQKNIDYFKSVGVDLTKLPKTKKLIPTSKKFTPIEGDVDEEYTTGAEFNVTPQEPEKLVSEMTMEERRIYDKKKRDEQMKRMQERRKSFNTKVRNINQQSSNNNTIDFNADK